MGLLSGIEPDKNTRSPEGEKAHQLWQWAQENNQNILNLAIQFCLRQPLIHINLTGSKNVAEVEQNFAARDDTLCQRRSGPRYKSSVEAPILLIYSPPLFAPCAC